MYPDKIIIHHSLSKDGEELNWQAIGRWHRGEHPDSPYKMDDIGYHYGVELIDGKYEILVGRLMTTKGAHTKGQNRNSLGICMVGNFDKQKPLKEQWDLTVALVASLCEILYITSRSVFGHTEFASKSCPGEMFNLNRFRGDVERYKL